MKNTTRVYRDGFVWLLVTNKAKDVFQSGLFELYALHEGCEHETESLIVTIEELNECLENGMDIGIEVANLLTLQSKFLLTK